MFERYNNEIEARKAHKQLFDKKVIDADFGATYFGYYKSQDEFGYFKLYGTNNVCALPGVDYKDYADELFENDFAFLNGHVFMR